MRTASEDQIADKVHARSVGRWRRLKSLLVGPRVIAPDGDGEQAEAQTEATEATEQPAWSSAKTQSRAELLAEVLGAHAEYQIAAAAGEEGSARGGL